MRTIQKWWRSHSHRRPRRPDGCARASYTWEERIVIIPSLLPALYPLVFPLFRRCFRSKTPPPCTIETDRPPLQQVRQLLPRCLSRLRRQPALPLSPNFTSKSIQISPLSSTGKFSPACSSTERPSPRPLIPRVCPRMWNTSSTSCRKTPAPSSRHLIGNHLRSRPPSPRKCSVSSLLGSFRSPTPRGHHPCPWSGRQMAPGAW